MRVMKFGGTSVATAERLTHVASLIAGAARHERIIVVVSALAGVTDVLAALCERATSRLSFADEVEALLRRHLEVLRGIGGGADDAKAIACVIEDLTGELETIAAGVGRPEAARDAALATGERLSLVLAAAACKRADLEVVPWDTRHLVRTDSRFGEAAVDAATTRAALAAARRTMPKGAVAVASGFIGADAVGSTTTLGRGGSDTSASIIGAALGARVVEIWTDVDGVLSAPPALAIGRTIPALTYSEAFEIARFGGKVLHPGTMAPVAARGIPLAVRNTFAPERPGTVIDGGRRVPSGGVVAVSALDGAALVSLAEHPSGVGDLATAGALRCRGPAPFPAARVLLPGARRPTAVVPGALRAGVAVVAAIGAGGGRSAAKGDAVRAILRAARVPVLAAVDTGSPDSIAVVVPRGLRAEAVRILHRALVETAAGKATAAGGG